MKRGQSPRTDAGDFRRVASHASGVTIGLAVSLSCLVGVIFRLPWMRRGLGQDELFTAVNFVDVPSIRQTLFHNLAFNNHVLYSAMAVISEKVFGPSEWALRAPALVLGIATICVVFVASRDVVGPWPAVLASLAVALSPAHIVWSVQARGYSALIFFTLLSSYFYLRLRRSPNRRTALCFVAAAVLGAYVHLYGVWVIVVQAVLAVRAYWRGRATGSAQNETRLVAVSFFAIGGVAFALYLPMLRAILRDVANRGHGGFELTFPWSLFLGLSGTDRPWVAVVMIATGLTGLASLMRSHRQYVEYFVAVLTVPLLVMWLFLRPFDLYARLFAYFLPFYLILVIAGLHATWRMIPASRQRAMLYLPRIGVALVVAAIATDWVGGLERRIPNEGYREITQAVLTQDPSAAFCAIGGARSVWRYYIKRPLLMPQSVEEFRAMASRHVEMRCVYYQATWESAEQTSIAQFLMQRAEWSSFGEHLYWFIYRPPTDANRAESEGRVSSG